MSALERRWELCWRSVNGPELVREHRFHLTRRWRFDFANIDARTAVEIEGGTWTGGRHTRGSGFVVDAEKYNEAALSGWVVFRLPGPLVSVEWANRIANHMRARLAYIGK